MKINFLFIFLFFPLSLIAQNYPSINSIYKFQYGASKKSLDDMGLELHSENDKGKYVVYWIDKATGTYAVIQFPDFRSNYLYGAQITGYNQELPIIEGLHLGDFKKEVFEFLGPPQDSNYVADLGLMHYSFKDRNYSVEIDESGRLYSFAFYGDDGLLERNGWLGNWQDYPVNSLAEVTKTIREMPPILKEKNTIQINGSIAFRPRVSFTGKVRTISAWNKEIIEFYSKSRQRKDISELFQSEIQVEEDSVFYWLPIQESLLEVFKEDTKNGEYPVDLFVTYIGRANDNITLSVNEFIVW